MSGRGVKGRSCINILRSLNPGHAPPAVYKVYRGYAGSTGSVYAITGPQTAGIRPNNFFRSPTIQKYDNVHGLEIQKIKDYASKE